MSHGRVRSWGAKRRQVSSARRRLDYAGESSHVREVSDLGPCTRAVPSESTGVGRQLGLLKTSGSQMLTSLHIRARNEERKRVACSGGKAG